MLILGLDLTSMNLSYQYFRALHDAKAKLMENLPQPKIRSDMDVGKECIATSLKFLSPCSQHFSP